MIQDKIFFDEKDPTGLSYNTPFTFYGSYQGRLWSKSPSGSIQYYTQNSDLSAYATTGSNQFSGSQTVTGSLTVTGGITGTATTASYVEYANVASKPTLVSGSSQVTYSGLTGIPSGIVSGSTQILDFGIFATTGSNGFNGSQSITGSLTVTGQVVAQTLNVQQVTSSIVYSSGSNIFGNSLSNTQQFTGSVGVTGSLTVNGAGTFSSTVTATNGIFINGSNQNTLGSGALELLTYAGYNSSANQSITLGLAIDEAVDNSRAYQYNLGASGNATGQNLVLTSKRRGTTDLTILTISTTGAATFGNSVTTPFLRVTDSAGQIGEFNSTDANGGYITWGTSGTTIADIGTAQQIFGNGGNDTFGINGRGARALTFGTNNTERLRITSGGNVGIGTNNPSRLLHILAPTGNHAYTRIEGGSGGYGGFLELMANSVGSGTDSAGRLDFYMTSTNRIATIDAKRSSDGANYGTLIFSTADNATTPTERMRITSGGIIYSRLGQSGTTARTDITPNLVLEGQSGVSSGRAGISLLSNGAAYGIIMFGSPNSTNTDGYIQYLNDDRAMVFGTADNARMRITSGGNVGIGITSPARRLQVEVGSTAQGGQNWSHSNGTVFARLGIVNPGVNNNTEFGSASNNDLVLLTNNSEKMRIASGGNVGINDNNPSYKLSVNGNFYTSGAQFNDSGYHYAQGSVNLRKLVNVNDNTTTTLLTFDQNGSYSYIGGGEILITFVDPGSPWGVYVWKGLISIRTVQFGSLYGTGIQEISSRNNLDGTFTVSVQSTKDGGVANAVINVVATTSSGISGQAYVSFNGWVTGGSQPV